MTEWQSNITLTAHWQPKQQYVYYYLDGGVFSDDITSPEIKQGDGVLYSLSALKATILHYLLQQNQGTILSVGE